MLLVCLVWPCYGCLGDENDMHSWSGPAFCAVDNHLRSNDAYIRREFRLWGVQLYQWGNVWAAESGSENRVAEVNLQSGGVFITTQVYWSSLLKDLRPIRLCDVWNWRRGMPKLLLTIFWKDYYVTERMTRHPLHRNKIMDWKFARLNWFFLLWAHSLVWNT